jgi:uncharacterized protein (TIGR00369 family)
MSDLGLALKKTILESFSRQKLMTVYGAVVTGISAGYFEITVDPREFLLRTSGIFHGGVIAALADSAGGYAATTLQPETTSFLTIEFKVNFLSQARGEKLIAKARVLKSGKTLTVAQTDIFTRSNGIETLVATALVTLMKANQ